MKRIRIIIPILIIVSLVALPNLPGCATSSATPPTTQPVDPIAIAADQVTVAVTALNVIRQTTDASGKPIISDSDWNGIVLPSVHAVQAALLAWQSAPAGTSDAAKAESAFLATLPSVLAIVENAQAKAHPSVPKTIAVQ